MKFDILNTIVLVNIRFCIVCTKKSDKESKNQCKTMGFSIDFFLVKLKNLKN